MYKRRFDQIREVSLSKSGFDAEPNVRGRDGSHRTAMSRRFVCPSMSPRVDAPKRYIGKPARCSIPPPPRSCDSPLFLPLSHATQNRSNRFSVRRPVKQARQARHRRRQAGTETLHNEKATHMLANYVPQNTLTLSPNLSWTVMSLIRRVYASGPEGASNLSSESERRMPALG